MNRHHLLGCVVACCVAGGASGLLVDASPVRLERAAGRGAPVGPAAPPEVEAAAVPESGKPAATAHGTSRPAGTLDPPAELGEAPGTGVASCLPLESVLPHPVPEVLRDPDFFADWFVALSDAEIELLAGSPQLDDFLAGNLTRIMLAGERDPEVVVAVDRFLSRVNERILRARRLDTP